MKKFNLLFLALFASYVFAAMPTTDAELDARIIKVMERRLISQEVKIHSVTFTRRGGAPIYHTYHTYDVSTDTYISDPEPMWVIKPQPNTPGGHHVWMSRGTGGETRPPSSFGFIDMTRPTGKKFGLFEIDCEWDTDCGLAINPRRVSNPYENRGVFTMIVEGSKLNVRNEYWGPEVQGFINSVLGWQPGT